MRYLSIILVSIFLIVSISYAAGIDPTICRSAIDEKKFKDIAGPDINVLAVCPKKGMYFVEILARENQISQFKEKILQSNIKVLEIKTWKEKTQIGSLVLLIEFEY